VRHYKDWFVFNLEQPNSNPHIPEMSCAPCLIKINLSCFHKTDELERRLAVIG